jgi:hypothetical protein
MFESGASHSKLELRSRTSLVEMLIEPDVRVMFTRPFRGVTERWHQPTPEVLSMFYATNFRRTTIDELGGL